MPHAYLAFDLGADSGRAIIGVLGDGKIQLHEVHRFTHRPIHLPTGLHWDITGLWREICVGLGRAARWSAEKQLPITSVGVDTWGVDWALVKESGELAGLPHAYRDPRNLDAYDRAVAILGSSRIYDATGVRVMHLNSLYSVYAQFLADRSLFDSAKLLFLPDLFHYWLSGEMSVEATVASTSQMVDCRSGDWTTELFRGLGLPTDILGSITPPGTVLGTLRPELARAAGLPPDMRVVVPAAHDTASAVAAVPVADGKDWCYVSSGTWSLLGAELDRPCVNEAAKSAMFTNELGVGGTSRFLKSIAGLWMIQECRRNYQEKGKLFEHAELAGLADRAASFRTLIDPDHHTFQAGGDMLEKISDFANLTGQPVPQDAGQFVRCCLESLALAYRNTLLKLESVTANRFSVLHIVGGGGKNKLLNQMAADATGKQVVVGPHEATATGNVLVQAMGDGRIESLSELRHVVAQSIDLQVCEPQVSRHWDDAYDRFLQLIRQAAP